MSEAEEILISNIGTLAGSPSRSLPGIHYEEGDNKSEQDNSDRDWA
jgi:hypothetical protein